MKRLQLSPSISISEQELDWSAVRAQGSGGQNVNKVSSAVHLRFDIRASSLPHYVKQRMLESSDSRINKRGVLVIKAQQFRTQEKNREDALARLAKIVERASRRVKRRVPTKATKASKRRRLDNKSRRGRLKTLRGPVKD